MNKSEREVSWQNSGEIDLRARVWTRNRKVRHAVDANNHREINTRKHIGVKDTHATSNSCNKQGRGSYNQMEEDKIMHGLKYNYSKSTTSAGRITHERGGRPPRNGPSTPLSMISLPPPPQILSLSPSLSLFSSI